MDSRVTKEFRDKAHRLLDESLDKLNTPKNRMKEHWSSNSIEELRDLEIAELWELNHAINHDPTKIKGELKDLINIALMIWDNLDID